MTFKKTNKISTRGEGAGSKERSKERLRLSSAPKGKTIERARKKTPRHSFRRKSAKTKPKKSVYKGFKMDSAAELAFAKLLDEFGVKWEKNTTRKFTYVTKQGYRRNYIPDFYLPEYDEWVEIKGRYYQTSNLLAQLEAVGPNIELIYSDELRLPECCAHLRSRTGVASNEPSDPL